ncbi:MAG TPA: zinc ribbon domain-containing protein [Longimicrobiaceae bacterium]|nr:zinc ribbon domain-containing protein [Longimicrobiaceae bacterium]
MTLLALSVLLSLLAAAFVVHPIWARRTALLADVASGEVLDAEARRRVALASLKEVEYDYAAGKLDDADYRELRDRLSAEALRAIRAADRLRGVEVSPVALSADPAAHACGFVNPPRSRFCAGCGARLA